MDTVRVELTGITPLLQNRDDLELLNPEFKKQKNEDWIEHQERIWRDKCHWSSENPRTVLFPQEWIRKMLRASQRQSANPIQPPGSRKKTDTLMPHFTGGIMIIDDPQIILNDKPVTDEILVPFKKMVSPNAGKVLCIRPLINSGWKVIVDINIINDVIRHSNIIDSLRWAGTYNGCGDWRVEKGGRYGMFGVQELK